MANWKTIYATNKRKGADISAVHLYTYSDEGADWNVIKELTKSDKLGYISALSPNAMEGGTWKGAFTISVHYNNEDEFDVKRALGSLCDQIFKETRF